MMQTQLATVPPMPEAMRCLTLTQPWAGLVASGIKLVENRPRAIVKHADFRKLFAIHASKQINEDVYRLITEAAPDLAPDLGGDAPWYKLSRITSAVIGVARIVEVMHIGGCYEDAIATAVARAGLAEDQLRWTFGPTAYVLGDVAALKEPVPCRGFQGFFRLPVDIEERVRDQLGGAP